jgi:hypothetical protein
MWVARTALEFGQIDFCEMVLRGIPEELKQDVTGYSTVFRKMEAARFARDFGNFLPGPFLQRDWWRNGPVIFSEEDTGQWVTGEVIGSSETGITLEAAVIDLEQTSEEPPDAEEIEIPADDLRLWGQNPQQIKVGDFVELVISPSGDSTKVAVHQIHEWVEESLPPLRPNPRRYL